MVLSCFEYLSIRLCRVLLSNNNTFEHVDSTQQLLYVQLSKYTQLHTHTQYVFFFLGIYARIQGNFAKNNKATPDEETILSGCVTYLYG
jgi:hypothetical protein